MDGKASYIVYPFRLSREEVLWAGGLCASVPGSGMAVQEFKDEVSRKQLPLAGVSQPVLTLASGWDTVMSLAAQGVEVVGTDTGATIGSFLN